MSLIVATPGGSAQFLSGNILGDGIIAPDLAGTINNFAPDYIQGSTLISMRPRAATTITGSQAAGPNTFRWFKNDSATFSVTFTDQGSTSNAANRFNLYGANLVLGPGQTAGFIYNGLTARWDLFTVAGNSSAPPAGAIVTFGPEETIVLAAGNNNNLTPVAGIANVNRLLLDSAAGAAAVTGIVAGANGQSLLCTIIGANDVEFPDESGLSLAANQLYGVGPTIIQRGSVLLVYSGTLSKWVVR